MVAKKADKTADGETPEVDMDRIKAMMGPLPNEWKEELLNKEASKQAKKNEHVKKELSNDKPHKTITDAAEEANATLKAMSPSLGQSPITKVDEFILAPSEDDDNYLEALDKDTKAEKTSLSGEGVVADDLALVGARPPCAAEHR